jgi:hypothetical protein
MSESKRTSAQAGWPLREVSSVDPVENVATGAENAAETRRLAMALYTLECTPNERGLIWGKEIDQRRARSEKLRLIDWKGPQETRSIEPSHYAHVRALLEQFANPLRDSISTTTRNEGLVDLVNARWRELAGSSPT